MTSTSTQTLPSTRPVAEFAEVAEEATRLAMPLGSRAGRTARKSVRWFRNPWVIGPVGLIVVASWLSAYSAWTDSVQASSTTSAGSIDITAGGLDGILSLTNLSLANVLPGANSYASVLMNNTGTSDIVYSMSSLSSTPNNPLNTLLGDALQLGVTVIPNGQTCDAAHYASPTQTVAPLATGLNRNNVFTGRALAAGQSETLCFKQLLPLTAPPSLMSAVTNTVFTFTASSPT